jgi:molybdopterin-guanine dinucleotide biosynthesis protein
MKLVMIGGHTRNIGKTSVVEGIIQATAELNWTAVKITQFGHGVCTGDCETCSCADNVDQFSITDELDRNTGSDTSRFLVAGARRSLWVRTRQGELYTALPSFKKEIEDDEFVIVESNSLRRFIKPDVYLQVFDPSKLDFKRSARQFFDLSDAYIVVTGSEISVTEADQLSLANTGLLSQIREGRQCFIVTKENRFIDKKIIEFVGSMLELEVSRSRINQLLN